MRIQRVPWIAKPPPHAAFIDWGNPLTQGMTACFLFDEPGLGLRDLVTNGPRQTVAAFPDVVGTTLRYADPAPVGISGTYTNSSYVTHHTGAMYAPYEFATADAFTMAFGGWFQARQFTGSLFGAVWESTRTNHITVWSGVGVFRVSIDATAYEFTQLSFDSLYQERWSDTVITWRGDTDQLTWHAFSNSGYRKQTLSTTNSPINFGSDPYFVIGTNHGLNTNQAHRGWYCYWYIWNRCLTDAEVVSLAGTPFGVFVPVIPRWGSVSAAAAFQSAWASRANSVVSSGARVA